MTSFATSTRARLVVAAAVPALMTAGCATSQNFASGQSLALGQNAAGDNCEALPNWTDPSYGDATVKYPSSYSVTCRSQQTSGALARVRLFESADDRAAFSRSLNCGTATPIELEGFSSAIARRCYDAALGFETVVVDADASGTSLQFSALPGAVGSALQASRLLVGYDTTGEVTSDRSTIAFTQLAAAPAVPADATMGDGIDLRETLQVATREIFQGLHTNASNRLKNALVNVGPNTPPAVHAELLLEAGLADSNIRYFGSAANQFAEAEALLPRLDSNSQRLLSRKLSIYRGLHALNRREFEAAKLALTPLLQRRIATDQPLLDPVGISLLNTRQEGRDTRSALDVPDEELLREVVLTSQASWALSVAALSEGDIALAREALAAARRSTSSVSGVDRGGILWLESRLDRQQGRIEAAEGNYDAALKSFDLALDKLTRSSLFSVGTGTEPAIAELELQRANIIELSGAPAARIDQAYADAVDALLRSRGEQSSFVTTPLEPYLNRLISRAVAGNTEAAADYFQALQISGESGAARQINQLQSMVAADSNSGVLLREQRDVQRRRSELRLLIREMSADDPALAELMRENTRLQQQDSEIEAKLQADNRWNRVTDRPAPLAELQSMLAPGESYLKLTVIGDSIYGMLIDADGATPYRVDQPADVLLPIVQRVRYSIDGGVEENSLREFDINFASVLYGALFGKVSDQLEGRSSLIVDGGQVLKNLSPAVLVTDPAAVQARLRKGASRDYSDIPFLVHKAPISIAISPSSFMASRRLGASNAREPLIGFADPQPLANAASLDQPVSIGPCVLQPIELQNLARSLAPIPRREVELAADALGLNDARIVSDAEFTDNNVMTMGAPGGSLDNYKILHFATHGLTEGQVGCPQLPAALLTSFGQEGSDMLLSFDEIAGLNLDANLVVLSACETASELGERSLELAGGVQPGDTLDGLVKAFFSAQARAVMATYWEASANVDSEIFFRRFYQSGRTKDIAGSLRDAQVELIDTPDFSHPFYWGAFFVVGNTANGMLADGGQNRAASDAADAPRLASAEQTAPTRR